MAEDKMMRLSQVARILNVGITTIVDQLSEKGYKVETNPNSKINTEQIEFLATSFKSFDLKAALAPGEKEVQEVAPKPNVSEDILYFRGEEIQEPLASEEPKKPEQPDLAEKEPAPVMNKLTGIKVIRKVEIDEKGRVVKPSEKKPEAEVNAPEEAEEKIPEPNEIAETAVLDTANKEEAEPEESKADLDTQQTQEKAIEAKTPIPEEPKKPEQEAVIEAKGEQLRGLRVMGKIELPAEKAKKKDTAESSESQNKRKRKRIRGESDKATAVTTVAKNSTTPVQNRETPGIPGRSNSQGPRGRTGGRQRERREEVSEKEVSENIKATMARMGTGGSRTARGRGRKRDRGDGDESGLDEEEETKVLSVTEFISANDLASLMDVSVQEVISVCLNMGLFVSINQRLDAEAITFIADEFGYEVKFISAEDEIAGDIDEEVDDPEKMVERAPIVTIMGHVDHGKTSLLDYIRSANVAKGEAGGITQHIGAYSVKTKNGKQVTFLDTPGHEAFTAMRARGAQVTDVVIIVIAADDSVMPQTREAINHAQLAGVPIVFAFSKVDKPGANAEKIREELAAMNLLVEEWGGKYQAQEISAKIGQGIDELLEKVLLEAELLDLKADPSRRAAGTVIEASLDKGRGYVATLLVEKGTINVGDTLIAGAHFGRVKAMTDYRENRLKNAGPSTPVQLLGLNGAPQAGDKFNVMANERDAREIATKREQILREQNIRTRKHITLEEIGRRKAIGSFKQLNLIVKGDVDGSIEALSDSLLQLSTEEVQVAIIHKGVGQISESDVNLAIASDAIIVGFQVRPSANAKKMAEQEQIEIRHYSVIYQAIEEVKDAMTGMLAPSVEEVITGNIEVREIFRISRIGTIAGCYVTEGFVKRNNKIRVIRDGIVIHTGEIDALRRFKDDVGEVRAGYECGLSIKNYNDIEVSDIVESFEFKEVKRTL